MAQESVETAVYRLRVEGQDQIDRMTKSIEGLAVAEEDATKATRTTSDELQKRIARYDPLIRAQQAYSKELQNIARYQETGVGTQQEINALFEGATARYQTATKATEQLGEAHKGLSGQAQAAMHAMRSMAEMIATGVSPIRAAALEMSRLSYAASGEGGLGGAFMQAGGALKQAGAAALDLVSPMNVAIAAVAALAAGAIYAALQMDKLQVSSQRAISGAGARTGTTISDINQFVGQQSSPFGSGTGLSQKETRALAEGLTQTGDIVIAKMHDMGNAVMGFANQTGKSVDDAIKDFVRFGTDPVKALDELQKAFGPLPQSVRDAAEAAMIAGDKTKAYNIILDATADKAKAAAENMGMLEKAARATVNALAMEAGKPVGLEKRLEDTRTQLNAAIEASSNKLVLPGESAKNAQNIQALSKAFEELYAAMQKVNEARAADQMNDLAEKARVATEAIIPQIKQIDQLTTKINELKAAQEKGVGGTDTSAALTAAQNQLQALKEAKEEAARYNDRVREIAAAWDGVGQAVALQLQTLQNNLQVLQAVGGAARMAAQYAADYANAIDKGKTAAEAAALAAANLAASQAQANSAAKETLWNLQNQAAAAAAVTDAEKRSAEAEATRNKLIHDGVEASLAGQVASQQLANAEASASAARQRADSSAIESAQKAGRDAAIALAASGDNFSRSIGRWATQMDNVGEAAQVASDYIAKAAASSQTGADAMQAINTSAGLAEGHLSGMSNLTANMADSAASAAADFDRMVQSSLAATAASKALHGGGGGTFTPDPTLTTKTGASVSTLDFATMQFFQNPMQAPSYADLVNQAMLGGTGSALAFAMGQQAHGQVAQTIPGFGGQLMPTGGVAQQAVTESDIISQVQSLFELQQSQTTDKAAQGQSMQTELAWLQSRPQSLEQQRAIVSLKQSIEQLTKSTDDLNATNQDLLSPYYTQDPRTSHIGFRSQGMALGGYVDVPGGVSSNDNMIATIPVASGERIYIDPMNNRRGTGGSGGGMTINISSPVLIQGNANKDDVGRTMFQNNQALAKQIGAATAR